MAVDEVQWYIRWYDPAETHYVPALRVGGSFYISKALWWRGVWLPFALSELISSELQWSLFFFFHPSERALNYYPASLKKRHTFIPCQTPAAPSPPSIQPTLHQWGTSPAGHLQMGRSLTERKQENIFHHHLLSNLNTHQICFGWSNGFKRCRVASVVESLINSGLPQLYNVTLHVGSLPELSIGCLQKHNVTQYVLHQLSAENTQKHKAAPGAVSAVLVTYLLGNKACDERWRWWWWWWWVRSLSEVLSRTFPAISASNELCLFRWSETSWAAIQ